MRQPKSLPLAHLVELQLVGAQEQASPATLRVDDRQVSSLSCPLPRLLQLLSGSLEVSDGIHFA